MDKYFKYGFFIAVLAVVALTFKMCSDGEKYRDMKIQESNLRKALTDSATHFKTKEGAWGVEKRTLQASLDELSDKNLQLSSNQKSLIQQVKDQNKTSQTIAAALLELKAEVTNIKNGKVTTETDSTVAFTSPPADTTFQYSLTVFNVHRYKMQEPSLLINKISFPNKQTINFHWKDDRKEGYPVSFSVVNTNPYFKVNDIQSYAIPELTREKVKPTFWQKVGTFSKSTGGKLTFLAIGFVAGAAIAK